MASIQGIYVALFGRPADPAGLAYFNSITNNGQDLTAIDSLAGEPEYLDRFTGMTNEQIVNSIYQALFERDGEPAGIAFFVEELEAGRLNINNIAIAILDGAQGDDLAMANAKIEAADLFTASLDTQVEIDAYEGDDAADLGRAFLDDVTPDNMPTQEEVDAAVQAVVEQEETNNPNPGGGGGGGGGEPPRPAYTNSYDDLDATYDENELYAGKGNPADGFVRSVNSKEGIELGLDVRAYKDPSNIPPDSDGSTTWTVPVWAQDIARFAYSVSAEDGLDNYDFRLSIDMDGSSEEQFLQLELGADDDVEAHAFNNSDSIYDWFLSYSPEVAVIQDDGGDAAGTTSQNVQSLQWYVPGEGRMAGDEHVVRLQAFEKGTNKVLAETEVTIKFDGYTERAVEDFDGNSDMVLTDIGATEYGEVEVTDDGTAIFSSSANDTGPFTRFDGYRTDSPDVVTTSIDITIDDLAISDDEGFSYSVAANGTDGAHMRDFIFHVARNEDGDLVVSANNNSSGSPYVGTNAAVIEGGEYAFEHTMFENEDGDLEVRMRVIDKADGSVDFEAFLSQPEDDFTGFGGNRYGWFTNIDVDEGIEVDNWAIAAQYFENNMVA